MSEPTLLTQPQVCERLGISDDTWRRWLKSGDAPPPIDKPGRPRWRRADIEALERDEPVSRAGRRISFPTAVRRRPARQPHRSSSEVA